MRRFVFYPTCLLFLIFFLPALVHLVLWVQKDGPRDWHSADWSSAGILDRPKPDDARVIVFAARTGGLKGAFATHSWIVLKKPGANRYDRYDVVGWGKPVRKNAYDADGRWYSNEPKIQFEVSGPRAASLIPRIEGAIRRYRWSDYGDYSLWPGPNSNTFVASIIRAVPGFNAQTPSSAVGRDYPEDGRWWRIVNGNLYATLGGYIGFNVSRSIGFEMNFLGLVAGFNHARREIKLPGFGNIDL